MAGRRRLESRHGLSYLGPNEMTCHLGRIRSSRAPTTTARPLRHRHVGGAYLPRRALRRAALAHYSVGEGDRRLRRAPRAPRDPRILRARTRLRPGGRDARRALSDPGARARSVRVRLRRDHRRAALPAGGDVPPVDPDRDVRGTPQQRRAAVLPAVRIPRARPLLLRDRRSDRGVGEATRGSAVRVHRRPVRRGHRRAVYGAIAGLGFVVIENLVYIAQTVDLGSFRSVSPRSVRATGSPRCARSPAPDTSSTPRSRDTTSGSPNSTLGTGDRSS